jgi:predicted O-methyltransferase YrrM
MLNTVLAEWNRLLGETYSSEDKASFFYALIKMQKPQRLLEIGTGVGVCSLFMAQAVKENGSGHVFTLDNGTEWDKHFEPYFTDRIRPSPTFAPLLERDFFATMQRLAEKAELGDRISFLQGELSVTDVEPITAEDHPFLASALAAPLDLVFCDIDHSPVGCLGILTKFLPLLAPAASIFIDSASTFLPSYLALEHTVAQMNAGKVPAFMLASSDPGTRRRLRDLVAARRFTLIHLTEHKERNGNGFAWLKVEPANLFPAPLTAMRGLIAEKPTARVSGEKLRALFAALDEPVESPEE